MNINVVLCTLLLFGAACTKDIGPVSTESSDEWNLDLCRRSYEEQSESITKLQDTVKLLSSKMAKQKEMRSYEEHSKAIAKLQDTVDKLTSQVVDINAIYKNETTRLSHEVESLKQHVNLRTDVRYDLNGTGCFMDVITMNCVGNGTLSITNAIYGKYASSCTGCCTPGVDDCTVLMSDQSPSEWDTLLEECNGKTSCSHQYEGEVINDCEAGYVADYMQISYTCPPDNVVINDAIGFTAFHSANYMYGSGDILQFDDVVTNIGNHYDTSNYTFKCPFKGMYMFSVSIQSNNDEYDSRVAIMREGVALIQVWTDGGLTQTSSSAVIIAECDIDQHVYVKATDFAYIDGDFDSSHFSGALIQRL